jgi:hypothetical protein
MWRQWAGELLARSAVRAGVYCFYVALGAFLAGWHLLLVVRELLILSGVAREKR